MDQKLKGDLKSIITETTKEVTSKIALLGKDLNEFKETTASEINSVKGDIKEVSDCQKKLEQRVTDMECQRTTWVTGVQEDMRRLSSVVVVPNKGPRQEDIDAYLDEFDKMKRGIGLAPFTTEDFRRIGAHLTKHNIPATMENILSARLMDFWEHDRAIDKTGVETLSDLMETCWWTPMPLRKNDNPDLKEKVIFARFKTESGKATMYVHAKWMNTMCKKKQIEPRRILMDVCPQLERRFGALNKLQHRFRHQQEAEMGPGTKCQTRIECAEDTIVIQYRFDEKEAWRNLDAEKHFKKEQIPGVPGTSAESSSTDSSAEGTESRNKRKKSTEVEVDVSKKSRKKGGDKVVDKKKTCNSRDIAEMLRSQPIRGKKDVDEGEEEEEGDDNDDGELTTLQFGTRLGSRYQVRNILNIYSDYQV